MNIFYVSDNPKLAAQDLNNKHVVKMILETAQILSTAHWMLDGSFEKPKIGKKIWYHPDPEGLYKPTHINHPSTVWARQSLANYRWLLDHYLALLAEYTRRYGKTHKCLSTAWKVITFPENIDKVLLYKEPPQCMPDQYKVPEKAVQAYRNYYIGEKLGFSKWKNRAAPDWILEHIEQNSPKIENVWEFTKTVDRILEANR